jgi:Uma2 family endonuclease
MTTDELLFDNGSRVVIALGTSLTYADLREMPEDGWRYELLEGDIVGSPAPSIRHQRVVANLALFLGDAVRAGFGTLLFAPTDVVLDFDRNALEPDLLFLRRERAAYLATETHIQGAPDLVVEVLSPRTAARDLGPKHVVYARHGVRLYWVVDPDAETVRVFELDGDTYRRAIVLRGDDRLSCPLFPGVTCLVADLFAG